MSIRNKSFITHISTHTHSCADLDWYNGPGFYGCIRDGDHSEWHGPYSDTEEARQKFGTVRIHSPALGSRSAS